MKKAILFCLIFLAGLGLTAQKPIFSKHYNIGLNSETGVKVIEKNNLIYTLHRGFCLNDSLMVNPCVGMICTDKYGEEQWTMVADSLLGELNNIFIADEYVYWMVYNRKVEPSVYSMLKMDYDGNIVDLRPIGFWGDELEIHGVKKIPTGFLLSTIEYVDSIEMYGNAFVEINEFLTIEERDYYLYSLRKQAPIITNFLDDGHRLVMLFQQINIESMNTRLVLYDEEEQEVWTHFPDGASSIVGFTGNILEVSDGYLINYFRSNYNQWIFNWVYYYNISKVDFSGNLLWNYEFTDSIEGGTNIFLTEEEDIIGTGIRSINPDESADSEAFIFKMGTDGEVEWNRTIVDYRFGEPICRLFSGLELEDGSLLFCGSLSDSIGREYRLTYKDAWLLRTDSNGCVYPDSCGEFTMVTPIRNLLPPTEVNYFELFPTLSKTSVTLQPKEPGYFREKWNIRIFNVLGQLQEIDTAVDFPTTIAVSGYPSGYYWVELSNEKGERQVLEFLRE